MTKLARSLLRVALVVLLLGSVLAQLLLPVFGDLVVPYSVAGILAIACGQVALLVTWRLLSMVDGGVIFTRGALRWVDLITACAAVATVLSAAPMVHLLFFVGVGGPLILWLPACLAVGLAFVLLMVVMRGLLEAAIADRSELDEVI
jgi:hypothetical protein